MARSEDVARLAGVSRATVSRALNGSTRVNAETRARVESAVASLGYEPDQAARNLVGQRSRTIAVGFFANQMWGLSQLGDPGHYFYLDVLRAIEHETAVAGYDLLIPSRPDSPASDRYIRGLRSRRVAGVLMVGCPVNDRRIPALLDSGIPTVFIDAVARGARATYVKSDNVAGERQLTEYLIALGHRRIALVTGRTADPAGGDRLAGFRQALAKAGIGEDAGLIRQTDWTTVAAYRETLSLLEHGSAATAILAESDMMAIGVLRALHERGLKVPGDISVAGFDDINLSAFTTPALTTVHQDQAGLGAAAVRVLVDLLAGPESATEPVVLPIRLVVRDSTGPPRSAPA